MERGHQWNDSLADGYCHRAGRASVYTAVHSCVVRGLQGEEHVCLVQLRPQRKLNMPP